MPGVGRGGMAFDPIADATRSDLEEWLRAADARAAKAERERDEESAIRRAANTQLREAESAWRQERDEAQKRIAELEAELAPFRSMYEAELAEVGDDISVALAVKLAEADRERDAARARVAELRAALLVIADGEAGDYADARARARAARKGGA